MMSTRVATRSLFFSLMAASLALTVAANTALAQAPPKAKPSSPATQASGPECFTIEMSPCKAERMGRLTSGTSILRLLLSGPPTDKLVRKGELVLDGRTHTFYLTKTKSYSVKNTGDTDGHSDNTSTLLSIDADGDGELSDDESWFANMPVRLDDAMFEITSIADEGGRIELRRSDAPLRGLVVGRKCPPFSFKTTDGRKVRLEDYRGKALLLDVWSVT